MPDSSPSLSVPHGSINEDTIHALVHGFYGKAMADPLLGPIFAREVPAELWPHHLEKMCAFWSSTLLKSGRYHGRPLPPHLALPELDDRLFGRWLQLFKETLSEVFVAEDAASTIALAERIAHSFRLARAFHEGRDSTGLRMLKA
ncbi:group III truncated hemoglobin [Oryzibacter oryziterrae]|uniref:group III truncated hemoglobin n=1 Tax=Oryzibacter oryziterrae TaxID=2766474 RepID=UPI001F2EE842|nr:group III truncated hemoglobin [Oryzibacter oryziterrae]